LASLIGLPAIVVTVAGIVAAIVLLLAAVLLLYRLTPNLALPWRWHVPGAVVSVVGWLLTTAAFAVYVANFGKFNATYGAIGGVVVLLLWLYLSSLVMLLGAEINQVLAEQGHGEEF